MSERHDSSRGSADDSVGFSTEDLPEIQQELLMDVLEVARQEHDPALAWDAFCASVWREAALAFGFVEREAVPSPPPRHLHGSIDHDDQDTT
jgi:hypothetical protein